ncbi:MAG: IS21 family transposase [Myxococcales bacterium]|nr:IS21 family transposase [Myxococcales bacterium]
MIEPEVVRQVRELEGMGWGTKAIARELGIARNTVRRYLRLGEAAEVQVRPGARRLDDPASAEAVRLFDTAAEGNAVVVRDLLAAKGIEASVRTVQRAVEQRRRQVRATEVASVRFETAPGHQMQIDFGEKTVEIAGVATRIHLLVAVLGYSRRIFVKPFLRQRGDDWREGIAQAFRHFGGVPRTVLGDNAKALVVAHDRVAQTVTFHPAYVQFCRDWDVEPRACRPYRARTKGKTEGGVKYVKRNGLAGRSFASFAALEQHLACWIEEADRRVHGTMHEEPIARFLREEQAALRPLPARPLPAREQRLKRVVSNDALVDVDTIRYSVPHGLVRARVEVLVGETTVRVFAGPGATLVATHARSKEPHSIVRDPAHFDGLWRRTDAESTEVPEPCSRLGELGISLDDYLAVIVAEAS